MRWPEDAKAWPLADHSRIIHCKPHRWHVQILGEGPDLLLIHGAGGATQSWRNLAPLLAQTHRVIAIDLPGQGFTRAGASRYGLDAMAADLTKLIAQEGWQPQALIGHSAGAAIALRMAQDSPRPVIGLNAALGTFEGVAGVVFPIMAKVMALNPLTSAFFSFGVSDRQIARLLKATGSNVGPEGHALYKRLASDRAHVDGTLKMMAAWDLKPLIASLPQITAPVTLIVGEEDGTVPPKVSRDAAAKLPNATLVTLPNLGHLAHEEAAETVAAAIRAAL